MPCVFQLPINCVNIQIYILFSFSLFQILKNTDFQYNEDCFSDQQCKRCWQMCSYANEPSIMNLFCQTDSDLMCPFGCQTACNFNSTAIELDFNHNVPLNTTLTVINEHELQIEWDQINNNRSTVIYSIFWNFASNGKWNFVLSTVSNLAIMKGSHRSYPDLAFRVFAVSNNNILAQGHLKYTDSKPSTTTESETTTRSDSNPPQNKETSFVQTTSRIVDMKADSIDASTNGEAESNVAQTPKGNVNTQPFPHNYIYVIICSTVLLLFISVNAVRLVRKGSNTSKKSVRIIIDGMHESFHQHCDISDVESGYFSREYDTTISLTSVDLDSSLCTVYDL
jgi:hypothetical protein